MLMLFFFYCLKYRINSRYFYILSIFLLFPFFLYWLWDWTFLPDQNKYASRIYEIRNLNYNNINLSLSFFKVELSSLLMALFPLPFVNTIVSVSLINRCLISFLILIFLKNKKLSISTTAILLFSPSIIVMSSVALRDTITFIFGLLFVYYFFNKKNFYKSLFFLILLILTKPHFALIILFISFFYYLLFFLKKKFLLKVTLISTLFFILSYHIDQIFFKILTLKKNFDSEEFNYKSYYVLNLDDNIFEFSTIFNNFLKFFFSPILTNSISFIAILIFVESLILFSILIFYLFKIFTKSKLKAIYLIFCFFLVFILLSIIVNNAGTLWRYKVNFLIIFVFIVNFISCKKNFKTF